MRARVDLRVRGLFTHLPRRFFVLALLVGSLLITASSLAYFDPTVVPPFVLEKLPVRFEALWLFSLHVHVAAAITSLPLCAVLVTRTIQRHPAWHRWLGRIAGTIIVIALVPTGIVLSFDAKGGRWVTLGFLLSGAVAGWAMVSGVLAARRKDMTTHARAMRHVVAQMSVAVTSRITLVVLDRCGVDPDLAYVVGLWGPVVISFLAADLLSLRRSQRSVLLSPLAEGTRRALSALRGHLGIRPRPTLSRRSRYGGA